ncbi:protein of unknown function [Bradyrhizobium vignae]|uniref:Uncharacterized protein n=1 Tax=Bradyrhizobium vignae TaxID=1549949 RepID=A0A2U3PUY7_9BRAD|nr:protein of unknown function [Bradyrhizobium vignae]
MELVKRSAHTIDCDIIAGKIGRLATDAQRRHMSGASTDFVLELISALAHRGAPARSSRHGASFSTANE